MKNMLKPRMKRTRLDDMINKQILGVIGMLILMCVALAIYSRSVARFLVCLSKRKCFRIPCLAGPFVLLIKAAYLFSSFILFFFILYQHMDS